MGDSFNIQLRNPLSEGGGNFNIILNENPVIVRRVFIIS
jgi:hypothetical protein